LKIACEKLQKTESGKEGIEAPKAQVSALENQLKELHEEDSKKLESMAVGKDQIEQLTLGLFFSTGRVRC
jgi:hypothetical protein